MNIWYPGHLIWSTLYNPDHLNVENEPARPATYEPVVCWRSVHVEPVRSEPATPTPAEPVTSFGNQGYKVMETAHPVTKPVEPKISSLQDLQVILMFKDL